MKNKLSPEEYYKSLNKIPFACSAIIRDINGEYLIIKNTYKEDWGLLGGMSEKDELPEQTLIREIKEEIGIDIIKSRLFCIDFRNDKPYSRILFLFDCGILDDEQIRNIKIDDGEIEKIKFIKIEEAYDILSIKIKERLENSFKNLEDNSIAYLVNGKTKS